MRNTNASSFVYIKENFKNNLALNLPYLILYFLGGTRDILLQNIIQCMEYDCEYRFERE